MHACMQAMRALLPLSPPGPEALDTLAPLVQRLAAAGDSSLLSVSSVAQLCALASAIIQAGDNQPLPRAAAAALVQLLSCAGVVQQLPSERVLQAVRFSLAGRRQLGDEALLPDALADALVLKLVDEEGVSPLYASVAVLNCGASPTVVSRAAEFMLQDVEFAPSRRSPLNLVGDLLLLHATALKEAVPVLDMQNPNPPPLVGGAGPINQVHKAVSTPLANYTLEAVKGVAEAARRGSTELWQEQHGRGAMGLVRVVEMLFRRFDGLHMRRREVLGSLHAFMDSMPVPADQQLHVGAADGLWSAPGGGVEGGEDSLVWGILLAAFALGEKGARGSPSGVVRSAK